MTGNERFYEAVRVMLGAPEGSQVSVDITGGNEVQIGDYTWDTEPTEIECMAWDHSKVPDATYSMTFGTIPELFAALWGVLDNSEKDAIASIANTVRGRST